MELVAIIYLTACCEGSFEQLNLITHTDLQRTRRQMIKRRRVCCDYGRDTNFKYTLV
jgi:hypothetical protein